MRFGIIHATTSAVAPLKNAILERMPSAQVINFVNEELLQYAGRFGIDDRALRMFAREIFMAQEAEVDAIMVACNVYAPYLERVRPFVHVPLLAVDTAMQQKAAAIGGRIGVMGTNSSSVPACISGIRKEAGDDAEKLVFLDGTVTEAADALSRGDTDAFDRLLTDRALQLEAEGAGVLVLAQLTMARAAKAMRKAGVAVPILTSPEEGAEALISAVSSSSSQVSF